MSRHQGSNGKGKTSGRGTGNSRSKSYARGNAPIKKTVGTPKPVESAKSSS